LSAPLPWESRVRHRASVQQLLAPLPDLPPWLRRLLASRLQAQSSVQRLLASQQREKPWAHSRASPLLPPPRAWLPPALPPPWLTQRRSALLQQAPQPQPARARLVPAQARQLAKLQQPVPAQQALQPAQALQPVRALLQPAQALQPVRASLQRLEQARPVLPLRAADGPTLTSKRPARRRCRRHECRPGTVYT